LELRAFAVEPFAWFVSTDPDDLSPQKINSENARVGEWMDRHPDGVRYCFELNAQCCLALGRSELPIANKY